MILYMHTDQLPPKVMKAVKVLRDHGAKIVIAHALGKPNKSSLIRQYVEEHPGCLMLPQKVLLEAINERYPGNGITINNLKVALHRKDKLKTAVKTEEFDATIIFKTL